MKYLYIAHDAADSMCGLRLLECSISIARHINAQPELPADELDYEAQRELASLEWAELKAKEKMILSMAKQLGKHMRGKEHRVFEEQKFSSWAALRKELPHFEKPSLESLRNILDTVGSVEDICASPILKPVDIQGFGKAHGEWYNYFFSCRGTVAKLDKELKERKEKSR
eukprot:Gregarina_sp_Poly_1__4306@NODE_233_length_11059_cov_49_751365_g206_i0_p7_GENE_NODE_233_length_11059_cov_49_751365_g206_i0NODE_233_length_11059_cov_49_751365_g206_i0_p7_ORF_typecomplete_len170_score30_32_NODE_233_length_11059_cov_49_751365_g206_i069587467